MRNYFSARSQDIQAGIRVSTYTSVLLRANLALPTLDKIVMNTRC